MSIATRLGDWSGRGYVGDQAEAGGACSSEHCSCWSHAELRHPFAKCPSLGTRSPVQASIPGGYVAAVRQCRRHDAVDGNVYRVGVPRVDARVDRAAHRTHAEHAIGHMVRAARLKVQVCEMLVCARPEQRQVDGLGRRVVEQHRPSIRALPDAQVAQVAVARDA